MFTLIYHKDRFNRPDTLLPFLKNNIGKSPLLRVDCISPYQGMPQDFIRETCNYLSCLDPDINVTHKVTRSVSIVSDNKQYIEFIEIQVNVA